MRPPPSNGQATAAPVREAQPKFPRKGHNRTTFPGMESDLYRMLRGVADRTLLCMNLKFLMISGISLSSPLQSARQKSLKSGGGREDGNRWHTQCRQHGGNWSGTAPEVQRSHCRGDARTGSPKSYAGWMSRATRAQKASRHRLINRTRIPCDEPHSSIFTKDRDSWRPCALGLRCSLSDIRTSSHSEFRANIDAHRGNGRD